MFVFVEIPPVFLLLTTASAAHPAKTCNAQSEYRALRTFKSLPMSHLIRAAFSLHSRRCRGRSLSSCPLLTGQFSLNKTTKSSAEVLHVCSLGYEGTGHTMRLKRGSGKCA